MDALRSSFADLPWADLNELLMQFHGDPMMQPILEPLARQALQASPLMLAGDPMGLAQKNAYKAATGASIDATESQGMPAISRGGQEVVPIPPNLEGLAQLLVKTGRAPDLGTARRMVMTR